MLLLVADCVIMFESSSSSGDDGGDDDGFPPPALLLLLLLVWPGLFKFPMNRLLCFLLAFMLCDKNQMPAGPAGGFFLRLCLAFRGLYWDGRMEAEDDGCCCGCGGCPTCCWCC